MIIPEIKSVRTKLFIFVMLTILLMCAVFAVTLYTMTVSNINWRTASSFRTSFAVLNEKIKSLQVDLLKYTDVISSSDYFGIMDFSSETGLFKEASKLSEMANLGNVGALAVYDGQMKLRVFAFRENGDYYGGYIDTGGKPVIIRNGEILPDFGNVAFVKDFLSNSKHIRRGYSFSDISGILTVQYSAEAVRNGSRMTVMSADFLDSTFVRQVEAATGMGFTYYINGWTVFDDTIRPDNKYTTLFPESFTTAERMQRADGMNIYFQRWVIDGDTSVDFGFSAHDYAVRDIRQSILMGFIMISFFVLVLVVPVSLFLLNLAVTKPLKELQTAVRKAESLDYDQFLPIKRSDDIGELVSAYNELIKRIKQRETELQDINGRLKNMVELETGLRQKNEQLLFEQQKFVDMGRMVNAIAHQWRQPLNIIGLAVQSYLITQRDGRFDVEEAADFEEKIMTMLQHMSTTIDDFRNFFRADKTEKQFSIINSMIEVIRLISAQMKYNGITLNYTCRSGGDIFVYAEGINENPGKMAETAIVSGFPGEMKQAVLNIIQNSKDAILKEIRAGKINEGIIDIILEADGNQITFYISDNGGGIDDTVMERMFEPYFTTKQNEEGTGIGLYMTRAIIENHMKGSITASNTKDGAMFTVILPKFTA
ncbi:HAMP domain-containing sensor histidine kinase [Seleniivibrio sp.]|uniref:sensor histidine kinase n=1 Tax=Seleniivibrio sp. TaxID=2898801 RepID=UPI0025D19940|nr:HAMP domain-containing sensor histidine kinase [Seleniivibrio sp.]MCD8554838.1 HAMP domain-containing histidine kinase [Seleniivibrio sp.]